MSTTGTPTVFCDTSTTPASTFLNLDPTRNQARYAGFTGVATTSWSRVAIRLLNTSFWEVDLASGSQVTSKLGAVAHCAGSTAVDFVHWAVVGGCNNNQGINGTASLAGTSFAFAENFIIDGFPAFSGALETRGTTPANVVGSKSDIAIVGGGAAAYTSPTGAVRTNDQFPFNEAAGAFVSRAILIVA